MKAEEQEAYDSFLELAKFIEEEGSSFAHVYRGSEGAITITMGIPKANGQERCCPIKL